MSDRPSYDATSYRNGEALNPAALQAGFVNRVFGWMTAGVALTGVVAWATAEIPALFNLVIGLRWFLFLGLILMVFAISAAREKLSAGGAAACFLGFATLFGLSLSWVFIYYKLDSLAATFFVTSGMFGVTGFFGYVTKRDLSGIGGIAIMALIGLIIASIVNVFFFSELMDKAICYLGVVIFIALTAWDMQKVRLMATAISDGRIGVREGNKYAVYAALDLYLDFINLFLFLLRLFGSRR